VRALPSSLLPLLLALLLAACRSAAPQPEPTPEYLALRPQSLQVVELWGVRDDLDEVVRLQLVARLRKLGYRVVDPGEPADAELRFFVEDLRYGRAWSDGVARAAMVVTVEVRGPATTLYRREWRGWRGEEELEEEFEEGEDRNSLEDIVLGWALDEAFDAVAPPDYEEMLEDAAKRAARGALADFPARMEPLPPAAAPAGTAAR